MGIDQLADDPLWSESVYLDAVSPDGTTGFVVRLCRYPTERTAWVWAHVFTPDGALSFNDSRVACTPALVAVDGADATYEAAAGRVAFQRIGRRDDIRGATATLEVDAHRGATAPEGTGSLPLQLDADFRPRGALPGAGNLPGRTEEHGIVTVTARWPGGQLEMSVLGQWHEQHQDAPRFRVPFTYVTVRGDETSIVAIVGPRASSGIIRRGMDGERATAVRVGPPADERSLEIDLADGSMLSGSLRTRHRYAVPIYGHPRPGTLVSGTLGGAAVSGCVNDWRPPYADSDPRR